MGLLDRLKTALGLDSGRSDGADASDRGEDGGVRVEREPDASTEAAVKGTDTEQADDPADDAEPTDEPADDAGEADESAAAGTDAAGSTGSITETPPEMPGDDDVAEAAEPAEAAGPSSQTGDLDVGGSTATGESDERGDEEKDGESGDGRPVREINGIGPAYERRLNDAGIETVDELSTADAEELAEAIDVAEGRVENWIDRARETDK